MNDFWLIAPYGWGSEANMIRVQKDDAKTALQALELASNDRNYTSEEGYSVAEEMTNNDADSVFVYDCKEVGEYRKTSWSKVQKAKAKK